MLVVDLIPMGLNLKNEETHRLVHELAALTGESFLSLLPDSRQRISPCKRLSKAQENIRIL
jgi:hypothetical protein